MVILQINPYLSRILFVRKNFFKTFENQMKKFIVWFLFFLCTSVYGFSTPTDSISTDYKNGEFVSYSQVWVNAPKEVLSGVVKDFEIQLKYDLEALYKWALVGMNLRAEKSELIEFNLKSTKYNSKTGMIRATGDVIVPYLITFPNINIDSKLDYITLKDGRVKVTILVIYSDAFLKKTIGVFYLIPKSNGCWITLETKVKFGWFFDIFISQNKFTSIMEWRFHRFMQNIKNEAERREKTVKQ